MRETRADTAQAFVFAVGLHVLLFALMFIGLWWTRSSMPQESWGVPVEAEVIDANALSPSLQRALKREAVKPPPPPPAPKEEPLPEALPEDTPPPQPQAQEKLPEPDAVDQEEVRADAVSPDTRLREQEAKQRQQQVDLDEQEQQKQEQEQQKQREILARLEQVRAERAKAKREADLAAQKLQQIADFKAQQASDAAASASPPPGNPNADNGLKARYAAALINAIRSNWTTRLDNVPLTARCVIYITQLEGGKVIDVQVAPSCPYDAVAKRQVEAAVLKAQPLPYAGFESVFSRELKLNFQAGDN